MQKIEEGKDYSVYINNNYKLFKSEEANYIFNMKNGFTMTWNPRTNEDPLYFPAPCILDIEVTTKCKGNCPECYKSNTTEGYNMSFDTFKRIIDVFRKSLQQVAIGADFDLSSNPDLWKMAAYCRENNIIPNITTVYVNDETAYNLSKCMGACAISTHFHLPNAYDICYDSVKRLTDRGMSQVNIHVVLEESTFDNVMKVFKDRLTDPRLEKLNAIVCLSLKQKGRGINHKRLSQEKFNELVKFARDNEISIGFDTCSSKKCFKSFDNDESVKSYVQICESTRESSFVNYKGEYFPCSFTEGTEGWEKGINVLECNSTQDFIDKVWNNPRTVEFRNNLIKNVCNGCRSCPIYDI